MLMIGRQLLALLLMVLAVAMPSGCGSSNEGPREERSGRDVTVGGDYGVVVERSGTGTKVKVGGDRGVVVDHDKSDQ